MILLFLLACGPDSATGISPPETIAPEEAIAPAARADLRLKRWRQLQLDLEGALELPPDEICKETGLYDCTDLHVVPLGGVSVQNGLYRSVDTLAATTSLAIERVVLQACWNRLARDRNGEDVVFANIDLESASLGEVALEAQVQVLYRRLLARDPLAAEVDALADLHGEVIAQGGVNADWALLSCFAIGTTTEALVY